MERLKTISEVVRLPEWPPNGGNCSYCGQPVSKHTSAKERKQYADVINRFNAIIDNCVDALEPNACEACEGPGYWSETCPIPGVLARVVANRAVRSGIERCDLCQRFPSDEAAIQALIDFGVEVY